MGSLGLALPVVGSICRRYKKHKEGGSASPREVLLEDSEDPVK